MLGVRTLQIGVWPSTILVYSLPDEARLKIRWMLPTSAVPTQSWVLPQGWGMMRVSVNCGAEIGNSAPRTLASTHAICQTQSTHYNSQCFSLSLSIHLAKGLGIYITKWLWSWRVRLWNWPPLALRLLNRSWAAHRRFEATTLRRISNCDRNKSCRKGLWGIICHNMHRYIYIYTIYIYIYT